MSGLVNILTSFSISYAPISLNVIYFLFIQSRLKHRSYGEKLLTVNSRNTGQIPLNGYAVLLLIDWVLIKGKMVALHTPGPWTLVSGP